ncbi:MAG: transglutaminase TgpA family protein [Planctomycetota bacterium]
MRLLGSFPAVAFALVLLSIVGACVAQASAELLLVAGVLAAMSWYVTEGPRGRTLPRWVCNLLIIAACLNVVADLMVHVDDPMGVLGRFAVWLTLIKLYERRTARDHAQLLLLSLLLMIAGCLQSVDLIFGVVLLVYAVLGLYALMLYQLYVSWEGGRAERRRATPRGYRLAPVLRPVFGLRTTLQFRALVSGLGAAGIVLSTLLFVIFPRRFGEGMIGRLPAPAAMRRVGFTDEIDLLTGGRITDARHQALTLRLLDEQDKPIVTGRPLFVRGAALDRYDGAGVWRTGDERLLGVETQPPATASLGVEPSPDGRIITQQYTVHFRTDAIFALATPVTVATDVSARLAWDPVRQTLATQGPTRVAAYAVRSAVTPGSDGGDPTGVEPATWPAAWRFDDDRVRALARERLRLAGVGPRPASGPARWRWHRQVADAFTRYLQAEPFAYTLDLSDVVTRMEDGRPLDPIVQFLLETRRGHCEYFASALAALCHTVGVQARVVSGFVARNYDETAGVYPILANNAHAWVEVRTGRDAWTAFDPSPPAAIRDLHEVDADITDRLRWLYQRFEGGWSDGVVKFDQTAQRSLVDSLNLGWSRRLTDLLQSLRQSLDRINRAFYFGPAGYVWMGIVALALVIAVVALVRLTRRSIAIRRTARLRHVRGAEYQRMLRQLGFYVDMLQALDRAGWAKPEWQPPLQFADGLAARRPRAAGLVRELSALFYDVRYGRRRLTAERAADARRWLEALPAALRERT